MSGVLLLPLMQLMPSVLAQPSEPLVRPLLRFDNEHDLSAKQRLLRTLTGRYQQAGPELLRLSQSTTHTETGWMAMRGMVAMRNGDLAPYGLCAIS